MFADFHESLCAKPAERYSVSALMARVLIVGCGCRGQTLARALVAEGYAVRGTTRHPARASEIEAAGAQSSVADPNRLATLMNAVEGVSVVCWLMGTAAPEALHGPRVESLLEHIVDTPARGLVYETGGTERPDGVAAVRRASATYNMPVQVLEADPADRDEWLAAASRAVAAVLAA